MRWQQWWNEQAHIPFRQKVRSRLMVSEGRPSLPYRLTCKKAMMSKQYQMRRLCFLCHLTVGSECQQLPALPKGSFPGLAQCKAPPGAQACPLTAKCHDASSCSQGSVCAPFVSHKLQKRIYLGEKGVGAFFQPFTKPN